MELSSPNGDRLALQVLGFEFPHATREPELDYHNNWLRVAGEVSVDGESWQWQDACMTRLEAVRLADWLTAVAEGGVRPQRVTVGDHGAEQLAFLEPVIAFNLGGRDSAAMILQVLLDFEALPPGHADGPLLINLTINDRQVRAAAAAWKAQITKMSTHP